MYHDQVSKWTALERGARSGLIFGVLFEITCRTLYLWENVWREQHPFPAGMHVQIMPYPFAWWYLPLLSTALGALASLTVNILLGRRIGSRFLLWQVIGLAAVCNLFIYAAAVTWYQWQMKFGFMEIDFWLDVLRRELWMCLKVLPLVSAFGLAYALVSDYTKGRRSWRAV